MDRETINNLAELKVQSKILRGLVDVIFDSCRLNYDHTSLVVEDDDAIMAVLKAFYRDEFNNRVEDLMCRVENKKIAAEEGSNNG